MNTTKMSSWAAALLLIATASARIVDNDYWTNEHNFINNTYDMEVEAGIAKGTSNAITSMMRTGWTTEGHPDDYATKSNVMQVKEVFSEAQWSEWFPSANSLYTYENFLRAAAKYPAFCGEYNPAKSFTDTAAKACRREIAALFSVMDHTSAGLSFVKDANCSGVACERGPFRLAGNDQYRGFSESFYEGSNTANRLITEPDLVSSDGYVAMASAMWRYMARMENGPSAHVVMSGFYTPNSADLSAHHKDGFGTALLILSPNDCSAW